MLETIFKRKIKLARDIIWKPYKIRSFSDGIIFFNLDINADFYRDDHNPKFHIFLDILNIRFISIEVYNILHEDKQ